MSGDDERDRDERPRRSWREIDQMRDKASSRPSERKPRGAAAEARARTATKQYLRSLDQQLFAKQPGGDVVAQAARSVRDAVGTPELDAACRAYLDAAGPPRDLEVLSAFLDAREKELVRCGLEALDAGVAAGSLAPNPGLRAQLRMLADGPDDELAEAAETVLERL